MGTLLAELASFQPTFVLAVPRVFEKVYNGAESKALADGKGKIFARAAETAVAYCEALDSAGGPALRLRLQHAVFDRLVYNKLRAALGGRCDRRSPAARRSGRGWATSSAGSASPSSRGTG